MCSCQAPPATETAYLVGINKYDFLDIWTIATCGTLVLHVCLFKVCSSFRLEFCFKKQLKTHLFKLAFGSPHLTSVVSLSLFAVFYGLIFNKRYFCEALCNLPLSKVPDLIHFTDLLC